MKIALIKSSLILVPLVGLATPALAQEGSADTARGQVLVTGSVARLCILGEPSRAVVDMGQMVQSSGAAAGRIVALGPQSVTLPGSFCNFAGSMLGITASALVDGSGTAPPDGFARAVNYTATASGWGDSDAVATTAAAFDGAGPDAGGTGGTQPQPKLGDVAVSLSSFAVPGNALLVAGNYSGLITVTLGPVPLSE